RHLADAWIPGAVVKVHATFGIIATYGVDRRHAVPMTSGTIGAFGFALLMAVVVGNAFGAEVFR
ncbi:MAG: hypothetical protein O6913_07040, partial [Chloroflexi bacterium]|nr:hypothetical protein [Chloroflexota bacterium]